VYQINCVNKVRAEFNYASNDTNFFAYIIINSGVIREFYAIFSCQKVELFVYKKL
jgi:hypothetical protein